MGIKQLIQDKHGHDVRNPWYSYSLIVLGLLIGLWFYTDDKLGDIKYENNFYLDQAKNKMMVKYPTTGDY